MRAVLRAAAIVIIFLIPTSLLADDFTVDRDVSEGHLNMRTGPGLGYPVVVEVPPNALLTNVGNCQKPGGSSTAHPWCRVTWLRNNGWVSSCCITRRPARIEPPPAPPVAPQPVAKRIGDTDTYFTLECRMSGQIGDGAKTSNENADTLITIDLNKELFQIRGAAEENVADFDQDYISLRDYSSSDRNYHSTWRINRATGEISVGANKRNLTTDMSGSCQKIAILPFTQ